MDVQRRDIKELTISLIRMSNSMDRLADAVTIATTKIEDLTQILAEVPEDPEED
jgi:hypothetical protein